MLSTKARRYAILLLAAGLIIAWSVFLLFVPPEELVLAIGMQNTYLVAFFLAVTTGVSTLTSTSFYAVIATFAAGGASPIFLGLSAGIGAFISNAIFYALFHYGKHTLTGKPRERVDALAARIEKLPRWFLFLIIYVYAGIIPLPDDILMAALAISSYSFVSFAPFLLAGNITIATMIGLLTQSRLGFF